MEIGIERSTFDNGELYIEDFQFEAFCLLGDDVEPCFEDSALEVFALDEKDYEKVNCSLSNMMQEYLQEFNLIQPSNEVVITNQTKTEGGEKKLEEKIRLAAEFGIEIDELDFALEDYSVDELREKFEAMTVEPEPEQDPEPVVDFALEGQFSEELVRAVETEKVETAFCIMPRYMYMDYDKDAAEVYAWDTEDWNLYGFAFTVNGDAVAVDFASKKRMKFAVVPFEDGELQASPFAEVFADASQKYEAQCEQYQTAAAQLQGANEELAELRTFKKNAEDAAATEEMNAVFEQFEDLTGIEAFEALRNECDEDCRKYSVEDLEEKCYAIRGRNTNVAKFSAAPRPARIHVDAPTVIEEPYGDLFERYGQK